MTKKTLGNLIVAVSIVLTLALALAGCVMGRTVAGSPEDLPTQAREYFDYALDGDYTVTIKKKTPPSNIAGGEGNSYIISFSDGEGIAQQITYTEFGGAEPVSLLDGAIMDYLEERFTEDFADSLALEKYLTAEQIKRTEAHTWFWLMMASDEPPYGSGEERMSSEHGIKLNKPLDWKELHDDYGLYPVIYISTEKALNEDAVDELKTALRAMYDDLLSTNGFTDDMVGAKLEIVGSNNRNPLVLPEG
jgi:hypothetical protein